MNRTSWDLIVVGAGPAGALSALLAARAGARTLLIDRKRFPRAKVCGGCLNASAVALLASLGLGAIVETFGLPVDQLDLGWNGKRASLPLPSGVTIPRTALDHELVRQAEADGACFLPETTARLGPLNADSRSVSLASGSGALELQAKVVVMAAGLGVAPLGDDNGFATTIQAGSRLGLGCVVTSFPETYVPGRITMAIGQHGYLGLTPTVEGLAVASALDPRFLKQQGSPGSAALALLKEAGFPDVPALRVADWSGTLPLTRTTRPRALDRVFLVGDAAGYVEPFTGQGMAIALQGALALAPYVRQGIDHGWSASIANAWDREYSRNVGSRHWPASLLAAMTRHPRWVGLGMRLARGWPNLPGLLIRAVNRPILDPLTS